MRNKVIWFLKEYGDIITLEVWKKEAQNFKAFIEKQIENKHMVEGWELNEKNEKYLYSLRAQIETSLAFLIELIFFWCLSIAFFYFQTASKSEQMLKSLFTLFFSKLNKYT